MTSYTLSPERRALLAAVAAAPMRSSATIADMVGRDRKSVGQMLVHMAADRLIRQCTGTPEDRTQSDDRMPEYVYAPVRSERGALIVSVEALLDDLRGAGDILSTALERLRGDERERAA